MLLTAPAPIDTAPLALADLPVPEPRVDEILVRVEACGICRTDLYVIEGELPPRRTSGRPSPVKHDNRAARSRGFGLHGAEDLVDVIEAPARRDQGC